MLLSPSLLHTAMLLPGPLRIPCSFPLWQLLQGIFLVPITNCHPQLPSSGCPLPAPSVQTALEELGLLIADTLAAARAELGLFMLFSGWACHGGACWGGS